MLTAFLVVCLALEKLYDLVAMVVPPLICPIAGQNSLSLSVLELLTLVGL